MGRSVSRFLLDLELHPTAWHSHQSSRKIIPFTHKKRKNYPPRLYIFLQKKLRLLRVKLPPRMKKILYFLALVLSLSLTATAQRPPDETHQIGDIRLEVRYWSRTTKPIFVYLHTGKRSYEVKQAGGLGGTQVRGDMVFPKRKDPLYGKLTYSGSLQKKSNVSDKPVGLRADAILLVPNEGLVGYTLTHTAKDSVLGDTQYGFIRWRLDLATGQISEVLTDEVVVVATRNFIMAETFLYVRQGPMKGQAGKPAQVHGYLFETTN